MSLGPTWATQCGPMSIKINSDLNNWHAKGLHQQGGHPISWHWHVLTSITTISTGEMRVPAADMTLTLTVL